MVTYNTFSIILIVMATLVLMAGVGNKWGVLFVFGLLSLALFSIYLGLN